MSRRRKPRTPATSSTPPNDGTPLGSLSDADLLREVARRRLAKGNFDLDAIEELAGAAQRDLGEETLAAAMAALPLEDDKPKACPKCHGTAHSRLRHQRHLRCEAAHSDEALQVACREKPDEAPSMLTVATDGSMLLTREESWKEVKVGVVARGGFCPPGEKRAR